jgi:hypothetical protein
MLSQRVVYVKKKISLKCDPSEGVKNLYYKTIALSETQRIESSERKDLREPSS